MKATIQIITKHGLKELTSKRIAKAVGISDAAIYRHFPNKEAILMEVLQLFSDRVATIHKTILTADEPVFRKLELLFQEKSRRLVEHPEQTLLMRSAMVFRGHPSLRRSAVEMLDAYKADVISVLRQGQASGVIDPRIDPEHLYHCIIGGLYFLTERWETSQRSFDLPEATAKLWNSIQHMLSNKNTEKNLPDGGPS
ncbi:MAG TPA: TetR/AcrR family transcriptional regulator [bacterium]|nr:TetR/AcrR family transcriptional regulator [bacterium]